jgi:hypothetical protein
MPFSTLACDLQNAFGFDGGELAPVCLRDEELGSMDMDTTGFRRRWRFGMHFLGGFI